jgi:hypothetical protein
MLIDRLQFSLHDATERNAADALPANLRVIKAQRHQLRADRATAIVGRLPLACPRMLDYSLHFLTTGSGARCSFPTIESVDQRGEASVDGLFTRTDVPHTLLMLICSLHHIRDHGWKIDHF